MRPSLPSSSTLLQSEQEVANRFNQCLGDAVPENAHRVAHASTVEQSADRTCHGHVGGLPFFYPRSPLTKSPTGELDGGSGQCFNYQYKEAHVMNQYSQTAYWMISGGRLAEGITGACMYSSLDDRVTAFNLKIPPAAFVDGSQ